MADTGKRGKKASRIEMKYCANAMYGKDGKPILQLAVLPGSVQSPEIGLKAFALDVSSPYPKGSDDTNR